MRGRRGRKACSLEWEGRPVACTARCAVTNTAQRSRTMHTLMVTALTENSKLCRVDSESALGSAAILLSRVRVPPLGPWPDGGPESLRSPCSRLAI
ncbi:hypothetical protein PoB_002518700 [Plakobranchus ocellatus]|uniref:Uncharacterized protein n=1 Tax=Plakobranchus ocellatus TaxID=259542 RepID=A0AAV3ZVH3_9GAST|nr:hypothetical protein PoB_002518700 [Plakobranchus ocellatus]